MPEPVEPDPFPEPEETGTLWDREPVTILGLMTTGCALLVAFGVDLSKEQASAVYAFAAASLTFMVRRKVSPVRK